MKSWVNKGDTPFLNGGGCLIAKCDDSMDNLVYDVLLVDTKAGIDGKNLSAQLIKFDLNLISQDDIREMFSTEDGCEELSGDEILMKLGYETVIAEAVATLNGKGILEAKNISGAIPSGEEDTYLTQDELAKWMKNLGAGEYL